MIKHPNNRAERRRIELLKKRPRKEDKEKSDDFVEPVLDQDTTP
jgi:hypothetical protein